MKKLSFKEVQERGNLILRFIKKICDENNIKYYLAYGTVLGAVRHKGFIPWDDDIDICMTRQEYHKFKHAMQNQESSYYLLDIDSDSEYFLPLAKVVDKRTTMNWQVVRKKSSFGVWVDVFILDNIPDDETLYLKFFNKMKLLKRLYEHSLYKCTFNSFKSSLSNVLLSWTILLGPRFFVKMITKCAQKYNNHITQRVASTSFFVYKPEGEAIDIRLLETPDLVDFEGEKYPVPSPYDTYLRNIYGDYMTLPPLEHRKPNHTAVFYQLD